MAVAPFIQMACCINEYKLENKIPTSIVQKFPPQKKNKSCRNKQIAAAAATFLSQAVNNNFIKKQQQQQDTNYAKSYIKNTLNSVCVCVWQQCCAVELGEAARWRHTTLTLSHASIANAPASKKH